MAGVYGDILASPLFSIGLLGGVEIHREVQSRKRSYRELHIPSNLFNCALKTQAGLPGRKCLTMWWQSCQASEDRAEDIAPFANYTMSLETVSATSVD